METFDENSVTSITRFADKVGDYSDSDVNDDFLELNLEKSIKELNRLNENEYNGEKMNELLKLNINLLGHRRSIKVTDYVIKCGFYPLYAKLLNYHLKQREWNYEILKQIFIGLSNLSCQ